MALSEQQISKLLKLVAESRSDPLDCDGCFEHLAEFAEASLTCREIPEALRTIETHLEQCPCCRTEFQALREALQSLDET